jgi:hypothetical protein
MSEQQELPMATGRRQMMRSLGVSGGELPGAGRCQYLAQNQKETNDG